MQPKRDIRIYPLDLSVFGTTPAGDPRWRVVWADSRLQKVEYHGEMHELQMYEGMAAGHWILEKWLSPQECHPSERDWRLMQLDPNLPKMPYPRDGDYHLSQVFPGEVVAALAYEWAGSVNRDQATETDAARATRIRALLDQSTREADKKRVEIVGTAMARPEVMHTNPVYSIPKENHA